MEFYSCISVFDFIEAMKFPISFGLFALVVAQTSALSIGLSSLPTGTPIGLDGRLLDTPEVAAAKAEHAVAHLNERINLANEALRSGEVPITLTSVPGLGTILTTSGVIPFGVDVSQLARNRVPSSLIDSEGRISDNSELRLARAEQAIVQLNEKLRNDPIRTTDIGSNSDLQ